LHEDEIKEVEAGSIDLVCGFSIIDKDSRLFVFEGLAEGAMRDVQQWLARESMNQPGYIVLANPEIRWSKRLYTAFDADSKRIKLRSPLPSLVSRTDIYNRSIVTENISEGLSKLYAIRRARDLRDLQAMQAFPSVDMLLEIENKYGEALGLIDIDGKHKTWLFETSKKDMIVDLTFDQAKTHLFSTYHLNNLEATEENSSPRTNPTKPLESKNHGRTRRSRHAEGGKRKADTDCWNPLYEEARKTWTEKDRLEEQQLILERELEKYKERREERERMDSELVESLGGTVFPYAGQKLQFIERRKRKMIEELSSDMNATYTYSREFNAQNICMVDMDRLEQDRIEESKAHWRTTRGFVFPAPKTREDFIRHPKKPSSSRIDMLGEEWVENEVKGPSKRTGEGPLEGMEDFRLFIKPEEDFGGYEEPEFEHDLDPMKLSQREELPRGAMTLRRNKDFWSSVHITGDGAFEEEQERKRKEREDWEGKVVVDNLSFLVDGFSNKQKPLQGDRIKDILHDPPQKLSLKMVRNAKLPSGKRVPLRPAPFTAINVGEYQESSSFAESLRPTEKEKFVTSSLRKQGEQIVDFTRYINKHSSIPRSQALVYTRKHPSQPESEKTGSKWEMNT
jgi:hypothetical protein